MELHTSALIVVAGMLCGAVNAIAGGGTLVLFPALVLTGMAPLVANVTSSLITWPGYVGGLAGFRDDLRGQEARWWLGLVPLAGSTTGCVLLLTTPSSVFDEIVPSLVLFASLLLAAQPLVKRCVGTARDRSGWCAFSLFLATIYGGYFGGGVGVILLGVLALTLSDSLRRLNALKGAISLVHATTSVAIFAFFGPVQWMSALVGAPSALVGGYLGARLARRLSDRLLRSGVVILGVAVAAWLQLRRH